MAVCNGMISEGRLSGCKKHIKERHGIFDLFENLCAIIVSRATMSKSPTTGYNQT